MSKHSSISGLLNINKPKGITSHDVVDRVRKLSKQRKVGHTGTLDPMATGVLLVCLGQATRLIEYLMLTRKRYRAVIRFGAVTDTLDAEGKIVAQNDTSILTAAHVQDILPMFLGEIKQTPPIFSALKKKGQPLYKRARAGEAIQPDPRLVTVYNLTVLAWQPPDLTLEVICSPGTYIRSLAHDIGQAAGPGAYLAGLIRTANGQWTLDQAVSLNMLERETQAEKSGWQNFLQPLDQAVTHLPKVILDEVAVGHVKHGRQIQLPGVKFNLSARYDKIDVDLVRAYTPSGDFLAILKLAKTSENIWQPKKVFQT
jgi:tRNA pseudouridine55 synthase